MADQLTPSADGHYLRALLDKPFTDRQLEIVTAGLNPQLVIAGAGSGKTTVMAARIVHAVAWHHIRPDGILGLTFTNKAASELAERVRDALARLDRLGPDGELRPVSLHQPEPDDQPTVSTYHAYAASLIKDHALRIGREPDSRLLTEAGRWQLALRVVRAAPGPYETWSWAPRTVAERMLDLDGEMAEHLRLPADVRAFDARTIASAAAVIGGVKALREIGDHCKIRDELLDLVDRYRARKADLDLVDFGDQVAFAAEIAQTCPEVGEAERERFPLVFLDEYQDTGVAQRVLLSQLFAGGHPVTAVGDPCQSIYGWRGASIGNLLRFSEHFPSPAGSDPLYLLTSFRNGSQILDAANAVSESLRAEQTQGRRPYVEVPPLEPGRTVPGQVRTALHTTVVDEVEWLADRLGECISAGTAPAEIAVLCRRRSDFALIHRALAERGIPVEVVGLGGLLEMPEVADVVAVLEVMAEPTANAALVRILTGPRYRIGPRDLKALGRRAAFLTRDVLADRRGDDPDGNRALAQAAASVDSVDVVALTDALESLGDPTAYSAEGYARLVELRAELTGFRPLLSQPIVEAVVSVIGAIGLDVEIEASPAGLSTARAANLSAFLDHAARFEGIEGESDLPAFLAYLVAAGDKERGLDVGGVSAADTVKLMTVHKAKGLEWSVVALPGLVDEIFPSSRGRSRWTRRAPTPCRTSSAVTPTTCPSLTPGPARGSASSMPPARRRTPRRNVGWPTSQSPGHGTSCWPAATSGTPPARSRAARRRSSRSCAKPYPPSRSGATPGTTIRSRTTRSRRSAFPTSAGRPPIGPVRSSAADRPPRWSSPPPRRRPSRSTLRRGIPRWPSGTGKWVSCSTSSRRLGRPYAT